jgi:hypothetical protein
MFITRAINKDLLATIVQSTFLEFGNLTSSSLLDSLKYLGFSYATSAGISINIEDLRTPEDKEDFLNLAQFEIRTVSENWNEGKVSDIERFQCIIDTWNSTTELLKNRITEYYDAFDPANNLYIMAFSGARGNMSQVRQLVGMRGLMADQDGRIIDLPIQTNFREGLTSIDYIISSYGARKGIVDTALKTADSGYLTRRLIYVAQDVIIREIDCFTKQGLFVFLTKKSSIKSILGRMILSIDTKNSSFPVSNYINRIFEESFWKEFQPYLPFEILIRSVLSCESNGSVCQKCYGWDLAHSQLISLGEAVGIIAAQSIGEPGTQLTMRTFHTGGIFTGELVKEIQAPVSGKLIIPSSLQLNLIRTSHGKMVKKINQEISLPILDWKNETTSISLPSQSYLYLFHSGFVKKNQKIAEYGIQKFESGKKVRKPVYTSLTGEISFENLIVKNEYLNKGYFKYTIEDGSLWIASGKIFCFPKEIDYFYPTTLKKNKPIGRLKLVVPFSGIVQFSKTSFQICTEKQTIIFELGDLINSFLNCLISFSPVIKSNQYVEKYTILGFLEFSTAEEGAIYSVKKKESEFVDIFFFITENDIWKINSDQINNYSFYNEKKYKTYIRPSTPLNSTAKFTETGIFLKKDGFQMIFQKAVSVFFPKETILKYGQGNFVLQNKLLAKLKSSIQQTEDIVQGLPKIEELIEARKPKQKAILARRPGVLVTKTLSKEIDLTKSNETHSLIRGTTTEAENIFSNEIQCSLPRKVMKLFKEDVIEEDLSENQKRRQKKKIYFIQSFFPKKNIILLNDDLKNYRKFLHEKYKSFNFTEFKYRPFQAQIFSSSYHIEFVLLKKKNHYGYIFLPPSLDVIDGKRVLNYCFQFHKIKRYNSWQSSDVPSSLPQSFSIFRNGKYIEEISKNNICRCFRNLRNDLLLHLKDGRYVFLEYLNPIVEYALPKRVPLIEAPGSFLDLGEPLSNGFIDLHDLLSILFQYHYLLDGCSIAMSRSRLKFQLIVVNSILAIYQSQGVNISTKHIELVVRQMLTKVMIRRSGNTPFLIGEIVNSSLILQISKSFQEAKNYKSPYFEPILLSATNSSLNKDGFLSAAGFQETKRVLGKAAMEGTTDWLRGLKECIIVGRLIPAGSTFFNYKNYLDTVYKFKRLTQEKGTTNG